MSCSDHLSQFTYINEFVVDWHRTSVSAGHHQQLVDEIGHPAGFAVNHFQCLLSLFRRAAVIHCVLALSHDYSQRSSQLVRSVIGELLLGPE